jgi:hypothetical protein
MSTKNYRIWTDDELSFLKELFCDKGLSSHEVAKILNRSSCSVRNKIKRLRLKHTVEQEHIIRHNSLLGKNNGMYQKSGPNKGLTTKNCRRIRLAGKKISKIMKMKYKKGLINVNGQNNGMFGKKSWCSGKTKENNEILKKAANKSSNSMKRMWHLLPKEEKNRRRKNWAMQSLKCPKKKTKIEIIVKEILNKLNVIYFEQFYCSMDC